MTAFRNLARVFAAAPQKKDVRTLRFIQEVNTTTRSCALWGLDEDTEYIVHVQSISMGGSSPPSEPVFFRTPKESEKLASMSPGEGQEIARLREHKNDPQFFSKGGLFDICPPKKGRRLPSVPSRTFTVLPRKCGGKKRFICSRRMHCFQFYQGRPSSNVKSCRFRGDLANIKRSSAAGR